MPYEIRAFTVSGDDVVSYRLDDPGIPARVDGFAIYRLTPEAQWISDHISLLEAISALDDLTAGKE